MSQLHRSHHETLPPGSQPDEMTGTFEVDCVLSALDLRKSKFDPDECLESDADFDTDWADAQASLAAPTRTERIEAITQPPGVDGTLELHSKFADDDVDPLSRAPLDEAMRFQPLRPRGSRGWAGLLILSVGVLLLSLTTFTLGHQVGSRSANVTVDPFAGERILLPPTLAEHAVSPNEKIPPAPPGLWD